MLVAKTVYMSRVFLSSKVKKFTEIEQLKFESPPHSVAIAICNNEEED
jgi:hypothetical protein